MQKKKICILTATRAEYGLLKNLIKKLIKSDKYDVKVVVTGMHLATEFGMTYKEIENDGIVIDEKIEILLSSDTPCGASKSMGIAMIGFADYFERIQPDMLMVLGDRYETLAVCTVALNARIPIAHIHGGETTEGVIDEAIRHSITKMSYLHFTSTEEYRRRVIQLGEQPERVFNVGALGVENIKNMEYLEKAKLEEVVGCSLENFFAILTFHPVTLENNTATNQFKEIINALKGFTNLKVIITKANADAGGRNINKVIDEIVEKYPDKYKAFYSLGSLRYLSLMKYSSFVIGNSSSGIIEAPTFKIPTINIGDRQNGRIQAKSIINCEPKEKEVLKSIEKALSKEFKSAIMDMVNPYGNGDTSDKIQKKLDEFLEGDIVKIDTKKKFYDLK